MRPEWMVEVLGDPESLETLSSLVPLPELGLSRVNAKAFLIGTLLDAQGSAVNAHALAARLLKMMNGLCVLADASFRLTSLGTQVFRKDTAGRPKWVSSIVDGTAYFHEGRYSWDRSTIPAPTRGWARMALSSPEFAKAVGFLSDGQRADDLYRVFEIVQLALGGTKAIVRRKLATQGEIRLFKRTMNLSGVGFTPARHAKQIGKPPGEPMLLPDAKRFVQVLLSQWVEDAALGGSNTGKGIRRE